MTYYELDSRNKLQSKYTHVQPIEYIWAMSFAKCRQFYKGLKFSNATKHVSDLGGDKVDELSSWPLLYSLFGWTVIMVHHYKSSAYVCCYIIEKPDKFCHYSDVITSAMAFQITGVSIVCWGANLRLDQTPASLEWNPLVTGGFPHKGPVTRKMFPFDDVFMWNY